MLTQNLEPVALFPVINIPNQYNNITSVWSGFASSLSQPTALTMLFTKSMYDKRWKFIKEAPSIDEVNKYIGKLNKFHMCHIDLSCENGDYAKTDYYKTILNLDKSKESFINTIDSYEALCRLNNINIEKDSFYQQLKWLIRSLDEQAIYFRLCLANECFTLENNISNSHLLLAEVQQRFLNGNYPQKLIKINFEIITQALLIPSTNEFQFQKQELALTKQQLSEAHNKIKQLQNQIQVQRDALNNHNMSEREQAEYFERHTETVRGLRQTIAQLKYRISVLKNKYEALVNGEEESIDTHPYQPGIGKEKPGYQGRINQKIGLSIRYD